MERGRGREIERYGESLGVRESGGSGVWIERERRIGGQRKREGEGKNRVRERERWVEWESGREAES